MVLTPDELNVYLSLQNAGPRQSSALANPDVSNPEMGRVVKLSSGNGQTMVGRHNGSRKSDRETWWPLEISKLGVFLDRCWPFQGHTMNPSPSSGGLRAVSPVIIINSGVGISRGAYVLDGAVLRERRTSSAALDEYSRRVARSLGQLSTVPAVIVALLCDWEAVDSAYENCTLATGLWDAGVLLQTMSMSAGSLSLPACISAVIPPTDLQRELGINTKTHGVVGSFTVGGAKSSGQSVPTKD